MYQHQLRLRRLPLSELSYTINNKIIISNSSKVNNVFHNPTTKQNYLYFSTKRSTNKIPKRSNHKGRHNNALPKDQKNLSPLEAVKSSGLHQFEKTTDQVVLQSRKLLTNANKSMDGDEILTIPQLRKAEHVKKTLILNIDKMSRHDPTFNLAGESIDVVDVEVSRDLQYARVIWSLPFSVDASIASTTKIASSADEIEAKKGEIISKMQTILETKGAFTLQAYINVSVRGRAPKLRFVHEDVSRSTRLTGIMSSSETIDAELLKYL